MWHRGACLHFERSKRVVSQTRDNLTVTHVHHQRKPLGQVGHCSCFDPVGARTRTKAARNVESCGDTAKKKKRQVVLQRVRRFTSN